MEEDDEPLFIEPEEDDDDYDYQWGPTIGPLPPGTIIG